MISALLELTSNDLRTIAASLRAKRLRMPVTDAGLSVYSLANLRAVSACLAALHEARFDELQVALLIEAILETRARHRPIDELIDLVASGPDLPGIMNRDTSVVVQQLFRDAKESVIVVGYSVSQGAQVFATLAGEMGRKSDLRVTMCLNVGRDNNETRTEYEIRHRYLEQFKKSQWPSGCPLPSLYFDPRSIDIDPSKRASLHAKCIVVDGHYSFVSSANFTERGQKRNIEIGVRIDSPHIAAGISNYILNLIDEKVLARLA